MRNRSFVLPALIMLLATSAFALAGSPRAMAQPQTAASEETSPQDEAMGKSGLPLPRFASLKSGNVNLRTGPGTRYPIEWVLLRKGIPLEITAEYESWRRVRDNEGAEGWVHKGALSGKRTAIITGSMREVRKDGEDASPIMARATVGATAKILSCDEQWCRLDFGAAKGFLKKEHIWGVYPDELVDK